MALKRKGKYKLTGFNLSLLIVAVLLTCVGLVMVFSSSYADSLIDAQQSEETATYMKDIYKQGGVALVSICFMLAVACLDYHIFKNPLIVIGTLGVAIFLLLWVFSFDGVRDSQRWIEIGGATFQSSEFAKLAAVLYVSCMVTLNRKWYKDKLLCFFTVGPIALMAYLIYKEPDLSTTLCLLATVAAIMFTVGINWVVAGVGCLACVGLFLFKVLGDGNYQGGRFISWLYAWDDPLKKGYQVVQSLYAIGDGGLFGVGLGNSKQKISNLPMANSDYIFSIIAEEFGFFLTLLVVGLFIAYAYLGIKIALNADDLYGTCLAIGVTAMICVQAGLNMAVATNVIPSTGLTLPFISSGSSSLLMSLVSTGVLLSVSGHQNIDKYNQREKEAIRRKMSKMLQP